ncbi:MAG: AAA family ATPase [Kiritimatiellales bacterium]|nr:AAA family ATPase [Kiritimatiellota bacterium]MBL7017247.1 AAA family ATPase [Kiritimatiellales bacterium]
MTQPKIIGIVGASGSGKTTVAHELAQLAGECCLISQDNYYRDLPDGTDPIDWNFDNPAVIDLEHLARDLAALKRGEAVAGPHYHFATHKRLPGTLPLTPAPIILVEGLFLFTTQHLRDVFDLKLFIDVPLAVCLERRVTRDVIERGRTEAVIRQRWAEQVEPMFMLHVQPARAAADVLLHPAEPGTPERTEQLSQCLNLNVSE